MHWTLQTGCPIEEIITSLPCQIVGSSEYAPTFKLIIDEVPLADDRMLK
jgi:hypothetical protein